MCGYIALITAMQTLMVGSCCLKLKVDGRPSLNAQCVNCYHLANSYIIKVCVTTGSIEV